jgi:glyoxylase-like metal-dependent hydrolase (beta-lactamase superfamily II)
MIKVLDLGFLGLNGAIAAFLVETSVGPVLVETGPHSVNGNLEKAVNDCGYQLSDIKHVFITHIHFDHAGGAWALAKTGATIYLHPFGKRHLGEPTKLYASAKRIYKDKMETLWGRMEAIDDEKLVTVEHGETITVGDTAFVSWHTPGHAVHHIAWQVGKDLFSGDVAGVKIGNGMVVPPCPPPDINIEDWLTSIQLIRGLDITGMYLTHFDKVTNISAHLDALETILWDWANWIKPHFENGTDQAEVVPQFMAYTKKQLADFGLSESAIAQYEAANPSWMSVAGLMRYWYKKGQK